MAMLPLDIPTHLGQPGREYLLGRLCELMQLEHRITIRDWDLSIDAAVRHDQWYSHRTNRRDT